MRTARSGFLPLFLLATVCRAPEESPLPRGHMVFKTGFEGERPLEGWSGGGKVGPGFQGARSLLVERPAGSPAGASSAFRPIPVEGLRGATLYCSATIRAEGVGPKPRPWNGIKFMLAIEAPGGRSWPQAEAGTGSFDWKAHAFAARIPADATAATLVLGLEEVEGKAWFDEVEVAIGKPARVPRARPPAPPVPRPRGISRLRGAMVGPDIDEEGLRVFGEDWNANLIRWQLIRYVRPDQAIEPADYDRWLDGELAKLDTALARCAKHGILVVVDLHSPPGGRRTASGYVGSDGGLFNDRASQDHFVEVWRRIALRYKGIDTIWGFDLANEPVEGVAPPGCDDWRGLAERAARAIREIDPERTIIVEPADWGGPAGLADLEPLDLPGIVYSVHMYVPSEFTHQGVFSQGTADYPGEIGGKRWDRAALEEVLRPVAEFQKAYGVPIYIGEFSAIRWAPRGSAFRYLKDAIEIFEERGWDWSYHAFREWNGWSVEHGEDREDARRAPQPTDRERLLRAWFAKNEKPPAAAVPPRIPGVIIDHIPASARQYIGSPGIASLPDGAYVASHDIFGPGSTRDLTRVFRSRDRGESWRPIAEVKGQWWSSLFFHDGALYLLGTSREYGFAVIRRSLDGGASWTEPKDERSGLLLAGGKYHCAPVPILIHGGRLWRAMEDAMGPGGWGSHFRAFLMSAPAGADLLLAASWTSSNRLAREPSWLGGKFGGWLEGNAVAAPDGSVVNVLRVHAEGLPERAAIVRASADGKTASFDPEMDFIEFPGGGKKFTIRRDPSSGTYWSLSNFVPEKPGAGNPERTRNTLALISSKDLRSWEVRSIVLHHPDAEKHAFQYVDWLFEGEDLIAVSRTAGDDDRGGAHNQHDANYLTFHRIRNFRALGR